MEALRWVQAVGRWAERSSGRRLEVGVVMQEADKSRTCLLPSTPLADQPISITTASSVPRVWLHCLPSEPS